MTTAEYKHLVVNVKTDGCDVYVGRPTKWGNPFVLHRERDRERVLQQYIDYINAHPDLRAAAKRELRGKVLGCHCAPKLCHAYVLAEIANS